MVNGARQICKTYIIEQFGRDQYESCSSLFGNVGVSGKKVTLPHHMAMFVESARWDVDDSPVI